ncbi:RNA-binding protein 12B-like [Rhinoderma darwinii]|uniref:RNA-binding protein 12B-like n=1 Tax=Rhinoderma darwinii TaxID=43563 RepID=UPI003F6716A4
MPQMVRLQGLPPIADSIHIRNFFNGLKIPHGGVNIIGGEYGEAFVKFMNKHNVCSALKRSGKLLMDSPIHITIEKKTALHRNRRRTRFMYNPGYLRISFTPLDAKFCHVKRFFKEFCVKSVIFLIKNKVRSGQALVKFGTIVHVQKILSMFQLPKNSSKGHKKQNAFSVLSVKMCSKKEWISCGGIIDSYPKESNQASSKWKWLPELPIDDHHSLYIREFYAHLVNVSLRTEKSHIRKLLHNLVSDSQITFVYDKNGSRQRECFVMFITENDYVRALELDKAFLNGRSLRVLPISKAHMMDLIESNREVVLENPVSEDEVMEPYVKYLYLRNFAACVSKLDVLNFFTGFSLTEKDICLLYDDNGDSLGEALVKFSTKEEASKAEKLNHKLYQETKILLRCISEEQLKVFGVSFLDHSTAN